MKDNYDFNKGERGKFFVKDAELMLPFPEPLRNSRFLVHLAGEDQIIMGKTKEKISIQLPKEIVEKIAELNNVDEKYVNRTIIRILKDEIEMENKIDNLKNGK